MQSLLNERKIDRLEKRVEKVEENLLDALDFFKKIVEIKQEITEQMQLIHDISGIDLTQQKQLDIQQKLIDYLVLIITDHLFWEKGENNRGKNFTAKIEEIKNESKF